MRKYCSSSSRGGLGVAEWNSFYRARSSRLNSREVTVSKAARPQSNNARTVRMRREGTDPATGMSAKQSIVTTSLGTLTLPTLRSLKPLCPRR